MADAPVVRARRGFEVDAGPMKDVFDPLLLAVLGASATLLGALGHSRLVARAEAEGKDLNGLPFVVVVLGSFLLFFLATTQLQQAPSIDMSRGWVLHNWSAP